MPARPSCVNRLFGVGRSREPVERRAADNFKPGACEQCIEPRRRLGEARQRLLLPGVVRQRLFADEQRRTGHGPRAEHGVEPVDEAWRRERKAEPQTGEAEEFSERSQHHDVAAPDVAGEACAGWRDIGERFIDDENAAARPQLVRDVQQRGLSERCGRRDCSD